MNSRNLIIVGLVAAASVAGCVRQSAAAIIVDEVSACGSVDNSATATSNSRLFFGPDQLQRLGFLLRNVATGDCAAPPASSVTAGSPPAVAGISASTDLPRPTLVTRFISGQWLYFPRPPVSELFRPPEVA